MALVVLSACARLGSNVGAEATGSEPEPSTSPTSSPDVERYSAYLGIDFDDPILGEPITTEEAARAYLPFNPVFPSGIGTLRQMSIAGPESGPPQPARTLAQVFDNSQYGEIDLIEVVPDIVGSDWVAWINDLAAQSAAESPDSEAQGKAEVVQLPGSLPALLTTTEDGSHSVIAWMEGEVKLKILGPTVDGEAVLALASSVVNETSTSGT